MGDTGQRSACACRGPCDTGLAVHGPTACARLCTCVSTQPVACCGGIARSWEADVHAAHALLNWLQGPASGG